MSRRWLIPLVCLVAFAATDATTRLIRSKAAAISPSAPDETSVVEFVDPPIAVAPFQAADLDGRDVSPASWRGRVAIVNFWATWCLPCRKELPALAALQRKYPAELVVVGVLQDGASPDFVRSFSRRLGVTYPIVQSRTEIERAFAEVMALPTTYIVDRDGRVVATHIGEIDPIRVEREVRSLFGS
jgi:thiol-disulfide isomerase/thioredoxin